MSVSRFLSEALRGHTSIALGVGVLLLIWQDGGVWLWVNVGRLSRIANIITAQDLTR
jgi:hypothetical protein